MVMTILLCVRRTSTARPVARRNRAVARRKRVDSRRRSKHVFADVYTRSKTCMQLIPNQFNQTGKSISVSASDLHRSIATVFLTAYVHQTYLQALCGSNSVWTCTTHGPAATDRFCATLNPRSLRTGRRFARERAGADKSDLRHTTLAASVSLSAAAADGFDPNFSVLVLSAAAEYGVKRLNPKLEDHCNWSML